MLDLLAWQMLERGTGRNGGIELNRIRPKKIEKSFLSTYRRPGICSRACPACLRPVGEGRRAGFGFFFGITYYDIHTRTHTHVTFTGWLVVMTAVGRY